MHNLPLYIDHLAHLSPWGIFVAVIASGHVVPIPEAVTLVILGYLSALGRVSFIYVVLLSASAAAVIDLIFYAIAYGGTELAQKLMGKVNKKFIEHYRGAGDMKLFLLVLASHFVPGWRFANPLIAGVLELPPRKFVFYTLLTVLIYTPMYVGIGYIFSDRIQSVIHFISTFGRTALIIFIVGVGVVAAMYLARSKQSNHL
jgi:membrane protein DedA with SNARE-associated domain